MTIWEKLRSFFYKKEKDTASALLGDVRSSMSAFALRVAALNDSYSEEKQLASSLVADAEGFEPLRNINAAKFEQDILIKLTEAGSACNAVLSTGKDGEFKKQLGALELLVKQRKSMKD